MKNTLIVHYHARSAQAKKSQIWQWQDGQEGFDCLFNKQDSFGRVATLTYCSQSPLSQVYFLLKHQDFTWQSRDFLVNLEVGEPLTHVWLVEGDDTLYYSRQAAISSPSYRFSQPDAFDMVLKASEFDRQWGYAGWLGVEYTREQTEFRLWAPTASRVDLLLYRDWTDDSQLVEQLPMQRGKTVDFSNHAHNTQGVWFCTVKQDVANHAYVYRLYDADGTYRDSRDPYMIAGNRQGSRSVILRQEDRSPEGFKVVHGLAAPWRLSNPNQAVIMEMHLRDFSKSKTSGVDRDKRGKFLGACQKGTKNQWGDATCFDYLSSLGINYIQLQPIFDHHQTLDEEGNYAYNWGYDPENYNRPTPIFSSDPSHPVAAIVELKTLIQRYHKAGIGVIMDVVYNHTYSSRSSAFQLTVPDYYYRMTADGSFENGSGCGNEIASEKEMVRKYLLDSIRFWIEEYHIDGFRFDLMGLHDVETMRAIRQLVDAIDPNILLYGEGWDLGRTLEDRQKAKKANADLLPGIGFFNDDGRNAIKGAEVYGHFQGGFVSGEATVTALFELVKGGRYFAPYQKPSQVVNYIEAHDNYNLNDLLWELHPTDSSQEHLRRLEVANVLNLLLPGMTFMQLGQEFCRSKCTPTGKDGRLTEQDRQYAMNSYNAPDRVNQIDWRLVTKHQETINLVKEAIRLKLSDDLLTCQEFSQLETILQLESLSEEQLVYRLTGSNRSYQIKLENQQKNPKITVTNIQKSAIINVD
ncbi:type I pullulanase [Streptococcus cuniculipharyngis]|uniref:pullulanase n=1 Tax=Streptococcus cuniculipharyngis TaxID=1562651 RepID=A0A5C5SF09_9STRE|nr:type I pullulanase [Streptococcus cuniculipharyngis]TWS98723.1 type I pullulanase [Streptococcus cuniculipharyngis]